MRSKSRIINGEEQGIAVELDSQVPGPYDFGQTGCIS